jgi:Uma2 family endonuclease
MSTLPKPRLTPEEYLEIERKAAYKSEHYRGEMFARSGARLVHAPIAGNAYNALRQPLRPRGCQVVAADLRVHGALHGALYVSRLGLYDQVKL